MSPATVALALPFWADVSLMERNDNGHTPSSAVMAFSRAHDWNSEAAPRKLAPVFRESWFGKALLPRLTFRAMDEREALELLADQATAGPDYKGQVRLLIEYLIAAGLAEREGNLIRAAKSEAPEEPGNGRLIEKEDRQPITKESGVVSPAPSINRVEFSVAISVDMAEIAGWEPARISAFFAGLAQVLAAKGKD